MSVWKLLVVIATTQNTHWHRWARDCAEGMPSTPKTTGQLVGWDGGKTGF